MRVLIAIDDFGEGELIATTAHRLFGETAEYMVMNVAQEQSAAGVGWSGMGWGAAYPLALPLPVGSPAETNVWAAATSSAKERAAQTAGQVVEAAPGCHGRSDRCGGRSCHCDRASGGGQRRGRGRRGIARALVVQPLVHERCGGRPGAPFAAACSGCPLISPRPRRTAMPVSPART